MRASVTTTTTWTQIMTYLRPEAPASVPTDQDGGGSSYVPYPAQGAPKIYVDSLKEFNGSPIDFEEWEIGTTVTIGKTAFAPLLLTVPITDDTVQEARYKELYM